MICNGGKLLEMLGQPFLSAPCSLALMLNIDWFQPFKHGIFSYYNEPAKITEI